MPDRADSTVEIILNEQPLGDTNPIPVNGTMALGASDAEIGAVEIKDGASDQRATVNSDGELRTADSGVGETTDAAVSTDANGSLSAKLRGLLILAGVVNEAAPANDTASSGLNGRLQRIAQRLTSILNVLTGGATAGTATLSNQNDQATNVTLSAANANRLGWTVHNDSTVDLLIKFGATASATSFTARVPAGWGYEMPKPIYTGIIDGIWTADASGAARITELST